MATNTSILGLTKPAYTDDADVAVINSNSDLIDAEAGRTRANFAAEYSTSSAYAVGAFCTHAGILYQCNTAIGSGGEAWTAGHWTQISAGDAIIANNQAIANLNNQLTNFATYKTTPYTGTTSSADVEIGSVSLPKGKYLLVECGSSTYPAYVYNGSIGHAWADNAIALETSATTTITLKSGRSASVTWTRYYVTFIRIA